MLVASVLCSVAKKFDKHSLTVVLWLDRGRGFFFVAAVVLVVTPYIAKGVGECLVC